MRWMSREDILTGISMHDAAEMRALFSALTTVEQPCSSPFRAGKSVVALSVLYRVIPLVCLLLVIPILRAIVKFRVLIELCINIHT
jgi:hypothetical protein